MMLREKKQSLSTKITAATLAGLILVFSIVAAGGWLATRQLLRVSQATVSEMFHEEIGNTEEAMRQVLEQKGKSLTEFASQIAATKIIAFDYEALKQYLKDILKDQDVIYGIYEVDFDNVVIADHIPLENTPWAHDETKKESEAIRALADRMIAAGYALEYSRDIKYNSQKIGTVTLGISKENLIALRESATQNLSEVEKSLYSLNKLYFKKLGIFLFLFFAGASVLLGALLYYIAKTQIINKLQKMAMVFEQVSGGDLTKRIDLESSDEIGDLCRAFNNMTGSLQKLTVSRDNLEESNRVLRNTQAELAKSHQELAASHQLSRKLIEYSPSGIMIIDSDNTIIDINVAGAKILDRDKEAITGRKYHDFFPAARAEGTAVYDQQEITVPAEQVCIGGDGREISILASTIQLIGANDEKIVVKTFIDITERKRVEEAVAEERAFLQRVIDAVVDPIMVIGLDHKVALMNKAVQNSVTLQSPETQALLCYKISHQSDEPCSGSDHRCPLEEVRKTGEAATMVHEHMVNNERRFVELRASPLWNHDGTLWGIIEATRDITDRVVAEKKLQELTITDDLTGLLNRRGFMTLADKQLKVAARAKDKLFLLYADLDDMKWINDNLGHKSGDKALKETAAILRKTFRQSDIICRLGGDEFAVLQTAMTDMDGEDAVLERLEKHFSAWNRQKGRSFTLSISTGVAVFDPEAPCTLEELMSKADALMYHVKNEKKKSQPARSIN